MDKTDKLVAKNTKTIWELRMGKRQVVRGRLHIDKRGQLEQEEEQSNRLMDEYYERMKELVESRRSIDEIKKRRVQVEKEQEEEERKLEGRE